MEWRRLGFNIWQSFFKDIYWTWKIGKKNRKCSVVSTPPHLHKSLSAAWILNRIVWRRLWPEKICTSWCGSSVMDKIFADSTLGKKILVKLGGEAVGYSLRLRSQKYASRTFLSFLGWWIWKKQPPLPWYRQAHSFRYPYFQESKNTWSWSCAWVLVFSS